MTLKEEQNNMEKKFTTNDYKTYVEVENALYKLGCSFIDYAIKHVPDGYSFFDFRRCDISLKDVRAYNLDSVLLIIENKYCTSQEQPIVVNAEELLDNPIKCAENWLEIQQQIEDKRRGVAKARAEEEKDYAEYQRLKKKYNW